MTSSLLPWLGIETHEQPVVQVGALLIVPQTQIVTLRTPVGIWRWVRPEALLLQGDEGLARLPIHDPTRWLWLGAWLVAAIVLLVLRPHTNKRASRRH